jgi:hypothetical protein
MPGLDEQTDTTDLQGLGQAGFQCSAQALWIAGDLA